MTIDRQELDRRGCSVTRRRSRDAGTDRRGLEGIVGDGQPAGRRRHEYVGPRTEAVLIGISSVLVSLALVIGLLVLAGALAEAP